MFLYVEGNLYFMKLILSFGLIICFLSSVLIISGCGQSGPLYLPEKPTVSKVPPVQKDQKNEAHS